MSTASLISRRSLLATASLLSAGIGHAQSGFPTKAIMMQIPFSAGTGNDLVGRILSKKMPELLGQPVVVENKPGASGAVATDFLRRSAPDGHTVMVASVSHSINPHTTGAKYTNADFTPIGMIGSLPFTLLVSKSVSARNVKELVDQIKVNAKNWSGGMGGTTGTTFVLLEQLKKIAGVELVAANYKGTSDAALDLAADRVQILFAPITTALTHRAGGNVKVLGVTGTKRTGIMPDVPTFSEQGFPKLEVSTWFGLLGPAGIPAGAVNTMSDALSRTLANKEIIESLQAQGVEPGYRGPAEFKAFLDADRALWGTLVKESGVKAN